VLDPLHGSLPIGADLIEAAPETGQGARLRLDRGPTQILEQIVVGVHAVERRIGRMGFVQVRKVVIDEMMQRFR
jgi:hypothetical protein